MRSKIQKNSLEAGGAFVHHYTYHSHSEPIPADVVESGSSSNVAIFSI